MSVEEQILILSKQVDANDERLNVDAMRDEIAEHTRQAEVRQMQIRLDKTSNPQYDDRFDQLFINDQNKLAQAKTLAVYRLMAKRAR
jgi:hypothetical protein